MFVELVDVGAKSTPERPPRTRLVHTVSRFSGFCEGPERDGGWGPSPERLRDVAVGMHTSKMTQKRVDRTQDV